MAIRTLAALVAAAALTPAVAFASPNVVYVNDNFNSYGVENRGRYIIDGFNGIDAFEDDNQLYIPASVWRIKLGVSYKF